VRLEWNTEPSRGDLDQVNELLAIIAAHAVLIGYGTARLTIVIDYFLYTDVHLCCWVGCSNSSSAALRV
jgi:hypothetical protein